MFNFTINAAAATNNADSFNSSKALETIDNLLDIAAKEGRWYTEWNSFSANDTKEVRQRIRFHYEALGFHITETCQGFRIGFLDAKEETHARDFYNRVAAIMDGRIETLGTRIQEFIEKVSNDGYHMAQFKLSKEESEIVSIIKNKLDEAGFKATLKDSNLTVSW